MSVRPTSRGTFPGSTIDATKFIRKLQIERAIFALLSFLLLYPNLKMHLAGIVLFGLLFGVEKTLQRRKDNDRA